MRPGIDIKKMRPGKTSSFSLFCVIIISITETNCENPLYWDNNEKYYDTSPTVGSMTPYTSLLWIPLIVCGSLRCTLEKVLSYECRGQLSFPCMGESERIESLWKISQSGKEFAQISGISRCLIFPTRGVGGYGRPSNPALRGRWSWERLRGWKDHAACGPALPGHWSSPLNIILCFIVIVFHCYFIAISCWSRSTLPCLVTIIADPSKFDSKSKS